jgi:hypothetical protein
MMGGMLAVTSLPPLIWRDPPAVDQVDKLASEFLQQESATAAAYANAIRLDGQLECLRERLILAVEEFGVINGHHALAGQRYSLIVNHPTVTTLNPGAVQTFHLAHPDLFPKIFTVHLSWSLAPGADDMIPTLPNRARTMFGRCLARRIDPPVLEVHSR